jgi:ornithine cyclodeaminase/alanine dehydrogenase-like protein (mu-crystallin family)
MKTILLSHLDLVHVVRRVGLDRLMDELVERLAMAWREYDPHDVEIPAREGFHYQEPATGLIEWMPLMKRGEVVLMKVVGYHPHSPLTRQLPTILSTFGLFDTSTGNLIAVMDGTFMTAIRTGAASAVASRVLAAPDSTTLGIIGCGAQSVTQLHALLRVFDITDVLTCDVEPMVTASFPARVAPVVHDGIEIRPAPVEEIVASSDILCTATSVAVGEGPVFDAAETRPWLHVNGVGSDLAGKTELPRSLLEKSLVCPDFPEQARVEGECQQLEPDEIGPELREVLRRPDAYAEWRTRRTVFDSTGWALEDHVILELVLEHARALSLGAEIQIASIGDDPRDPYEFLKDASAPSRLPAGEAS